MKSVVLGRDLLVPDIDGSGEKPILDPHWSYSRLGPDFPHFRRGALRPFMFESIKYDTKEQIRAARLKMTRTLEQESPPVSEVYSCEETGAPIYKRLSRRSEHYFDPGNYFPIGNSCEVNWPTAGPVPFAIDVSSLDAGKYEIALDFPGAMKDPLLKEFHVIRSGYWTHFYGNHPITNATSIPHHVMFVGRNAALGRLYRLKKKILIICESDDDAKQLRRQQSLDSRVMNPVVSHKEFHEQFMNISIPWTWLAKNIANDVLGGLIDMVPAERFWMPFAKRAAKWIAGSLIDKLFSYNEDLGVSIAHFWRAEVFEWKQGEEYGKKSGSDWLVVGMVRWRDDEADPGYGNPDRLSWQIFPLSDGFSDLYYDAFMPKSQSDYGNVRLDNPLLGNFMSRLLRSNSSSEAGLIVGGGLGLPFPGFTPYLG